MPRLDVQPAQRCLRLAAALLLALPCFLGGPTQDGPLSGALRAAEAGAPPLSQTYRDKNHKFSLRMFRDHKQVPQPVTQQTIVVKFRDPKSKGRARGTADTEVEVVRVNLAGEDGPVVTGSEGRPPTREEMREARRRAMRPKTVWDATVGRLRLPPNQIEAYKKAGKIEKIKSKDKPAIPGTLHRFDITLGQGRWQQSLHVALAEFQKDGVAFGVFMTCGGKLKKSYSREFKKIAKSFKWFDKKAKDVKSLKVLEGVNITAKKRREIERSMVDEWAVVVSPKKNYVVLYNTKNGKNHALAKLIARRIELIRAQIYEKQFPPARPIDTVCIVRVCADKKEYVSYGGPPSSAGYWNPGAEELVFFDASAARKADRNTLAVLYHEAFHQYIHYSVGRVAPHSWFNEGHGDYYAGAEFSGGKFKIKPFQWRVGVIKGAIVQGERPYDEVTDDKGQVQRRWQRKGYTPLEHLVRFTQREYYSYAGVCYAQGWSLIYFLREIVPKNKKYNEKWGHILDTYFDTLKAEVNRDGSLDRDRERRKKEAEEDAEEEEQDDGKSKKKKKKKAGKSEKESEDNAPPDKPTPDTPTPDTPTPDTPTPDTPTPDTPTPDTPTPDTPTPDTPTPDTPTPDTPTPDTPTPDTPTPEEGDDDEEDSSDQEAPRTIFRGVGGAGALQKAVEAAFAGVDWEEFTAAWLKGTKKGK